jgi:hypothetical protein
MEKWPDKGMGMPLGPTAQLASWPTPTTRDWKDGSPNENVPVNALLGGEVWVAGWPTPMAGTPAQKGYNEAGNNDSSRKTVALAGWQTPVVNDAQGSQYSYSSGDKTKPFLKLPGQAHLTGWNTPAASDGNGGKKPHPDTTMTGQHPSGRKVNMGLASQAHIGMRPPTGPARLTASGEMLTGSAARMESGGQLHPEHSLWLQLGPFATVWARCAARVTPSTSRKRKASSKP